MATLRQKLFVAFFSFPWLLSSAGALVNAGTADTGAESQTGKHDEGPSEHFTLVVIGAGSGGLGCARRAAGYGVNVALIEESLVGGTCANWGCMPKKVMWLAADAAETVKAFPYYGFLPIHTNESDASSTENCDSSEVDDEEQTRGRKRSSSSGHVSECEYCYDSEEDKHVFNIDETALELDMEEREEMRKEQRKKRSRRCREKKRDYGVCFSWNEMQKHRNMYINRLRARLEENLKNERIPLYTATASFLRPMTPGMRGATKTNTSPKSTDGQAKEGEDEEEQGEEAADAGATAKKAGATRREKVRPKIPPHRLLLQFKDGSTKVISADHVVIATGARRLRAKQIAGVEYTSNTDQLMLMEEKPDKVAILGSSYTATELSSILAALGVEVHLFFRSRRLLARVFDKDMTDALETEMQRTGVILHRGVRVAEVAPVDADGNPMPAAYSFSTSTSSFPSSSSSSSSTLSATSLSSDSDPENQRDQNRRKRALPLTVYLSNGQGYSGFDAVISALGVAPAVEALKLKHVGVELRLDKEDKAKYIYVDEYQNTTAPRIYAVGDVTGKGMLASSAIAAGRLLADRLFGGAKEAYMDYSTQSTVAFSYPPIAGTGITEMAAVEKYGVDRIQVYKSSFVSTFYGPWTVDAREKRKSVVKLVCLKDEDDRILGIQIMGRHSEEIMQGFAVAVHLGARKRDLDRTLAIHPTSAEEVVTLQPWKRFPVKETL